MEEIYNRIEDYLDGNLSETERAVFEADVQADPALAAALADVREARERLSRQWAQVDDDTALRQTLQHLGQQHFASQPISPATHQPSNPPVHQSTNQPINQSTKRWWWAVAAIAAAALLAWLLWPKPEPDQRLYAEYRHFPEASFSLKSGGTASGQALARAEADFNQKNYADALAALQAHLAAQPDDLDAQFFEGLCQLELGQTAEATAAFSALSISGGVWTGEARWYLALCHLRSKNWGQCVEALLGIRPGEPHYEEAQRLMEQMKKQRLN